jgi:hypothetical protein
MTHIKIMKFCQNHWSLLGSIDSTHGGTLRFDENNEKILSLAQMNVLNNRSLPVRSDARARISKRLRSRGIDSEASI